MNRTARVLRRVALFAATSAWLRLAQAEVPPNAPGPSLAGAVDPAPEAGDPDQADLIESIDTGTSPSSAGPGPSGASANRAAPPSVPAPPPSAAPPPEERMELHGWARQSVELGLWKRSSGSDDDNPVRLPYDQLTARTQLFLRARYSRAHWFEANVSGLLSYALFEQAPATGTTTFNGFNGQSTRSVVEARLYELFLGFYTSRLDVRIGQQRVAWGNTEFLSPNDVVNARDLRDPLLGEAEYRNIPTLLVRADLDLGFATLQGLISPAFEPDRFDVYGSNWAAVQPDAPVWARGLARLAQRSFDPTLQEQAQRFFAATQYPRRDFSDPVLGAKLAWSVAGLDVNHYYQYGFDGPLLQIDSGFAATLGGLDFSRAGLADLQPWLAAIDAGRPPLTTTYVRRHHVGMDLAKVIGPLALRLDGAYDSKKVLYRPDLTGAVSPTVRGVLSAEYQTGDRAKLAILEVHYLRLLDPPPGPVLIYRRDSLAVAANLKWPLWRGLGFDVRAMVGVAPRMVTLQPELDLDLGGWRVSAGGLWLDGEEYSLGSHFRRNLTAYSKLKWLF